MPGVNSLIIPYLVVIFNTHQKGGFMKFAIIILSYIIPFSLLAAAPNDIVATYWDGSKKFTFLRKQFHKELGFKRKIALRDQKTQKRFLRRMIIKKVASMEARKQGLHKKSYFKDQLKKYIQKKVLLGAFINAHFPRDREFNYKFKLYRTRHIVLRIKGNKPVERKRKRRKMQNILQQIKIKGVSIFPKLARQYGEDGSASSGGKLGLLTEFQMGYDKTFLMAARALSPGQVSDIVTTKHGLHLIKCDEIVVMTPGKFRKMFPKSNDRKKARKRKKLKNNIWYTAVWKWINRTIKKSRHIRYRPRYISRGKEHLAFFKIIHPGYSYSVTAAELRKVMKKIPVRVLKRYGIYRKKNNTRPFSYKELQLYQKWFITFPVLKYGGVIHNVTITSFYKKKVVKAKRRILVRMLKKRMPDYKMSLFKKYRVKLFLK